MKLTFVAGTVEGEDDGADVGLAVAGGSAEAEGAVVGAGEAAETGVSLAPAAGVGDSPG